MHPSKAMVIEMASVINYKTTTKLKMNKMNKVMTLAAIVSVSAANAAVINISASDATYIRSDNAAANFQSSTFNVANDNGNHRIAFWQYDLSAISETITDVTWSLTENAGSGGESFAVVGMSNGTIDFSAMTWNTANTDGHVASNAP